MSQMKGKKVKKAVEKAKPVSTAVISGQLQKQILNKKKTSKEQNTERGIVFISNLPHGFYEKQIKGYFRQYGKITQLRLVRSKRTGGSKGFAYVEFEVPDVAKIAAETMTNTQMFQKVVKAAYIPPEEQKYDYFRTSLKFVKNKSGKIRPISSKTRKIARCMKLYNNWDEQNLMKRSKFTTKKLEKLNKKFPDVGINFSELMLIPPGLKISKTPDASRSNSSQEEATMESSFEQNETEHSEDEGHKPQTGNLLLMKKRKSNSSDDKGNKKKTRVSNQNMSLRLEDLLGTTLNEDSSDEDFIPLSGSDDEDEELEEELSGGEFEVGASSESDSDEGASKAIKKESAKASHISKDRFEQLLKRKPDSTGIQKPKKKSKKTAGKEQLKVAAAKEILSKQNKPSFKKTQKKGK